MHTIRAVASAIGTLVAALPGVLRSALHALEKAKNAALTSLRVVMPDL